MIQFNWIYLLKASLCFSILYAVFYLLFKNLTHHKANRFILISVMLASLIIPTLNIYMAPAILTANGSSGFELGSFDGVVANLANFNPQNKLDKLNSVLFIKILYSIGFLIFAYRFVFQLLRLFLLRYSHSTEKQNKLTLIFINKNISPFSFFYWIFMPAKMHAKREAKTIIEHEKAHANQWHTLDLLIVELFTVFFWFVPFVYSFKNSIKNVHEFLADSNTIEHSNKIEYLKLLSAESEKYSLVGLSSNFYSKTLKKRITMITKNKSNKYTKFSYLLILPIIGILIQSFSSALVVEPEEKPLTKTVNKISFIHPINQDKCKITVGFQEFKDPISKETRFHKGIDYKANLGTNVLASSGGKVIRCENKPKGYGMVIAIQHANGFNTVYSHLSEFKVKLNDEVKKGQIIGLVGNTGRSTGPHLHFEIRKDGEHVNPNDYLVELK